MPNPDTELIRLAGLRRRYFDLLRRASETEDEIAAIKDRMSKLGHGEFAVGEGKVTISPPNKRFNPELADTVLRRIDPNLVSTCSVSKIDSSIAKRVLSPVLYEQCQETPAGAKDRVVIK
jgi:hypothetical protein